MTKMHSEDGMCFWFNHDMINMVTLDDRNSFLKIMVQIAQKGGERMPLRIIHVTNRSDHNDIGVKMMVA